MNNKQPQDRSSKIFGVRMTMDDVELVRKAAADKGMTMSAYIRSRLGLKSGRKAEKPAAEPLAPAPQPVEKAEEPVAEEVW